MRILAIETTGHAMSVALVENDALVSEIFWHAGLRHSEKLIATIDRVMAEANWTLQSITRIAVSTGPGSFTGIRVGLSCARTLAQHLCLPLSGITTLDILEAAIPSGKKGDVVIGIIDALRDEVYVKHRTTGEVGIETTEALCRRVSNLKGRVTLVGNIVTARRAWFAGKVPRAVLAPDFLNYPHAGILGLLASHNAGTSFDRVEPLYVRRSWAEEKPLVRR
ncbi:MAG: tRNA (adenosine(37)-N6)-threonylcarbamoyltransferase complex dimerization subunit type 1 TsaB [Endomicrobiales bacterium]|jgi:tRNA threonylcarbamoyladenosine biosynthesis protein TsaB